MKFKINIKKLISHTIALFMVAVMLASVCVTTQAKSSTPVSHKYDCTVMIKNFMNITMVYILIMMKSLL